MKHGVKSSQRKSSQFNGRFRPASRVDISDNCPSSEIKMFIKIMQFIDSYIGILENMEFFPQKKIFLTGCSLGWIYASCYYG